MDSVSEALLRINRNPPDGVVAESRLPDGNGLTVIEALAKQRPDARSLVLTGYGNIATAVAAIKRGAADYLAIARNYHTVILVGIQQLGPDQRNEAARFVTLIDALYEHKVNLIATADAEPAELYPAGDGRFEFERTVSRLIEMQSRDYLALGHGEN